ncbi:Oidioi.mRNA.OKI2018_I69.chr1.g1622.t1.cds [Oikopleura dioica]|uniref:Oidioi.mRNA.OKI2018_I69.chr1.g1622.t1.cds n=1 Tax=Oikopleura dioica TaxID=34765 RepID=A0ABN7SQ59_OIKDI|nr:Oidioi.mRNA.OKI2018_I69.chr1.g1622.t1.cds [Oikopleura dioica]
MIFSLLFSGTNALYNEEFVGTCNAPTTLDFQKLKFIPWQIDFESPWLKVSNPVSPEVNEFYLDEGIRDDMCWGMRYSIMNNVKFHSRNLGGKFDLYIPKEIPDWMSVRCTSEEKEPCTSFEIQYCCPSTFDNDEELEKAERPFPVFNYEQQGSCSDGALQFENDGSFIDIDDDSEFLSHWFEATNPSSPEVNGLFFNPGTRRDICRGIRLKNMGYDFSSYLFGGEKNVTSATPDWMTVRCGDPNCHTFEAKYCCPALEELDSSIVRPDIKLHDSIKKLVDTITNAPEIKRGRFKNRMTQKLKTIKDVLLVDFWNRAKDCFAEFSAPKNLLESGTTEDEIRNSFTEIRSWIGQFNSRCDDKPSKYAEKMIQKMTKEEKKTLKRIRK